MGAAFPADPSSGLVDMSNDTGGHPPNTVNFDYGWYDEINDSWWHANHCDPLTGNAECRSSYPPHERMKVYQSTLGRFSHRRYFDADKQVFCVALSHRK